MNKVVCVLLSLSLSAVVSVQVPLTLLVDQKAKCMDGTQSGYYYQASSDESFSTKWVIHLQGGGECATRDSCYGELNSNLGSSKYFDESMYLWFLCTDDHNANPDWAYANHVHIPYCSGDLHSGTVLEPNGESFDLYFSGHYVFEAVIDELISKYGLGSATDVVLSGDSAGGIGVWMNLDYLADRIHKLSPSAKVVGAPIAGFYFYADEPYTGPDHTSSGLANFSADGMNTAYNLWKSYVDADCYVARAGADPYACIFSAYSYPYISTPTFITEAQTDQVVLEAHDWVPSAPYLCNQTELQYVSTWRDEMLSFLRQYKIIDAPGNAQSGAFVPACYTHTGFSSTGPFIVSGDSSGKSYNYNQAFNNWYYNRNSDTQLYDKCSNAVGQGIDAKDDLFCNPSCSSPCN